MALGDGDPFPVNGMHTSGNGVWTQAARPPSCCSSAPPGRSRSQPGQVCLERQAAAEKTGSHGHPRAGPE